MIVMMLLPPANKFAGNLQTGFQGTCKQDCGKPASQSAGNLPTKISKTTKETTAETTADISSAGGAGAPPAAREEIAMVVALANTCATASTTTLPSAYTFIYTVPVTPVKRARIGVLNYTYCDESRIHSLTAWISGFFVRAPFMAVRAGGHCAHRFLQKVSGTPTRSSRRPDWRQGVGCSKPTPFESRVMALITQGRISAPTQATSATHPHQLFADAVNAASMASWYTRRGNIAAAARKARQHLAALRALAKLEGVHHA